MRWLLWAVVLAGCAERANPNATTADAGGETSCADRDRDGYGDGPDCRAPDCDDANAHVHPGEAETCDGLDNDCDGVADDHLDGPACALTLGVCAGSRQRCVDGAWAACAGPDGYGPAYEPDETSCDGLDNDCDGAIDEQCPCTDGRTQPCGPDEGECRPGVQRCVGGRYGACEGAVGPSPEACDGRDDDCDGRVDEALDPPACALQEGVCAGARATCGADGWSDCGATEYGDRWRADEGPADCDGLDNDCDGRTDEGCDCADGAAQPCGPAVGACQPGTQTCAGGHFGECEGAVGPAPETCDGTDEDCDGHTDEGLEAPACALQAGVCAGSTQTCAGGWVACDAAAYGPNYAETETADQCDRLDNDCDGLVDEACTPPHVVISEVYANGPGADGPHEFVELAGPPGEPLSGLALEAVNGGDGRVYATIPITGAHMPETGDYLVVEAGTPGHPGADGALRDLADQAARGADLQNGPDSVRLTWNGRTLDALAYGVFPNPAFAAGEGAPAPQVEGQSLTRDDADTDTGDNAADFRPSGATPAGVPTPGGAPLPRVHVSLRWPADGADLDLHLLRAGGTLGNDPDDCYWGNRAPDWGARLTREDEDGAGPEFLEWPQPAPGRYRLEVHDFGAEVVDPDLASEAVAAVFVDGAAALSLTRTLDGSAPYWSVAVLDVAADGTVTVNADDQAAAAPFDGP